MWVQSRVSRSLPTARKHSANIEEGSQTILLFYVLKVAIRYLRSAGTGL